MSSIVSPIKAFIAERQARRVRDQQRRIATAIAVRDPSLSADLIDEAIALGVPASERP